MNNNDYLGQYLDLTKEDGDENAQIEIVRIIGEKGIDKNGKIYPFSVLDTFQKLNYIGLAPEIAAELAAIDPSLVSEQKRVSDHPKIDNITSGISSSSEPATVQQPSPTEKEPLDEIAQFIKTAVNLSKKKGEKSNISLMIDIEFPFDIEKVALACSDICGEDSKILNELFKYSNISLDTIRKAAVKALMQPVKSPDKEITKV